MSPLAVHYRRGPRGRWLARVRGYAARAWGRTLREARRRLEVALRREAPALDLTRLVDRPHLTQAARRAVRGVRSTRKNLRMEEERLRRRSRRAAVELVRGMGLSLRDAGSLLELSAARVLQLVEEAEAGEP